MNYRAIIDKLDTDEWAIPEKFLSEHEEFLQALDQMHDCAGVAVGLDRILLLLSNSELLDKVLSFPLDPLLGTMAPLEL